MYSTPAPATVPGATVDATGCPAVIPFDFDRDGDVDRDDLAVFTSCYTGPSILGSPSGCPANAFNAADRDGDLDVDQADFGIFQRCYGGANKPAQAACAG